MPYRSNRNTCKMRGGLNISPEKGFIPVDPVVVEPEVIQPDVDVEPEVKPVPNPDPDVDVDVDVMPIVDEDEDVALTEFSDEIDSWIIDVFKSIGCDTAKSILELGVKELSRRTDLEEETITEVQNILRLEFEE